MTWIWIPIIAILAGVITEYIKVMGKQRDLGSSSQDLQQEVERLKARLETLETLQEKRIANLETIVISQTWETLSDKSLSDSDKRLLLSVSQPTVEDSLSDTQKISLLAQKIK
jgi:uncharacterized membrane-anchored protein YhcB (DUF1043 family)